MLALILLLVLAIGIVVCIASIYNNLVQLRNRFKNAFAQIDVQLKRRYDLIPNLVESVKGYMAHERQTLEAVIAARNHAVTANSRAAADPTDAGAMQALALADRHVSGTLGRLFALSEAYPDLKADATMQNLMEELSSTENKVAFARQAFNDAVMFYNNAIESFPSNLIANNFSFKTATMLESTESPDERKAIKVAFN